MNILKYPSNHPVISGVSYFFYNHAFELYDYLTNNPKCSDIKKICSSRKFFCSWIKEESENKVLDYRNYAEYLLYFIRYASCKHPLLNKIIRRPSILPNSLKVPSNMTYMFNKSKDLINLLRDDKFKEKSFFQKITDDNKKNLKEALGEVFFTLAPLLIFYILYVDIIFFMNRNS